MFKRLRPDPQGGNLAISSIQGFTLIEVLVVSIIVAILAAIAIPTYTGYIKNQRKQAALALAQTAAITASSMLRRTGSVSGVNLTAALFLPNAAQFSVVVSPDPAVAASAPRLIIVSEISNPGDPAIDTARF